jgi:hypothetical protein
MARLSRWLRGNYDGVITIAVVIVTLLPKVLNIPGYKPPIDQALLVALGLLAFTIMRHQGRADRADRADRESVGVRILNRDEVRHEHQEAHKHTSIWMFKGGTGTYLRAVTLPSCVQNAHREQRSLRVQAEIIDPTNRKLCEYYSDLRQFRPDLTGELWTPERTRNEGYATILAASWYQQRFTILRIEVALSATVPTFRWDLSSTCVLMTQEDHGPHLLFGVPSPHYNLCTRELDSSFRQARRVPLELAKNVHLSEEPTLDQARCLFGELGIPLPESVGDGDVAEIVRRALHPKNPYP